MNELDAIQLESEKKIRIMYLLNQIELPKIYWKNKLKVKSKYLKDYSFDDKIQLAKSKIVEFLEKLPNEEIMISFSGGRDSCVLRDLVHKVQDEIGKPRSKLLIASEIFHPETLKFIKQNFKNEYEILPPLKSFEQIINENGYPIISKQIAQKINHLRTTHNHKKYIRAIFGLDGHKYGTLPLKYIHFLDHNFVDYEISHKCCDYIKGRIKKDKRPVFIGTTINESRLRKNAWIKYGCIQYHNNKSDVCKPLSLFTQKDIDQYIKCNNIEISNIYKLGYLRSGCVCCGFGLSLEEKLKSEKLIPMNRFELLYKSNKELFTYFFIKLKMWKPLADCQITLNINDPMMAQFNCRKKEIKNWYRNIDVNLNKVLDEIEKRNPLCFNKEEKKWIFQKYRGVNR